ncbi:MAG TPA: hypothetical protein VFV84_08925 [Burkholderiales bacterium]|nr:hypothetical protein [Burkholderiales bacterium]
MKILLPLLTALLASAGAPACELPGGPAQSLKTDSFTVLYRAAPIQVGRHFTLDLAVCPPPESVRVDASMPAHRHGMNYQPSVVPLGDGRYRAEGLMFHMPGDWQFLFEVRSGGKTERATHDLHVE